MLPDRSHVASGLPPPPNLNSVSHIRIVKQFASELLDRGRDEVVRRPQLPHEYGSIEGICGLPRQANIELWLSHNLESRSCPALEYSRAMPTYERESRTPEDIPTQITLGQWLVAASAGLTAASAGQVPDDAERAALGSLGKALRDAAKHESIVAISGDLGLVSAREAAFLVDTAGSDAAPALKEMAKVLSQARKGVVDPREERAFERVRQLLLALSELRLAQARNADRPDPAEPRWPTTLSSAS